LLREASASFYAAHEWVRHNGHPRTAEDAARHAFVGGDRSGRYLAYMRQVGLPLEASNFSCHAENMVSNWALVRAGLGIGPMMDDIAERDPAVVRVLDDVPCIRFPIWLVTHRELHTARRIRVVFDMLAEALGAEASAGSGTT
jgi:DNA-binding transcriptional LysR family regulator